MVSRWRIRSIGRKLAKPLMPDRAAPRDKRFPVELAGVEFKQKKYAAAKHDLRRALQLDAKDEYANEFLATIYFLEGNLEAALKYWNRIGKPQIEEVRSEPALRVRPALLDHAFRLCTGQYVDGG